MRKHTEKHKKLGVRESDYADFYQFAKDTKRKLVDVAAMAKEALFREQGIPKQEPTVAEETVAT